MQFIITSPNIQRCCIRKIGIVLYIFNTRIKDIKYDINFAYTSLMFTLRLITVSLSYKMPTQMEKHMAEQIFSIHLSQK